MPTTKKKRRARRGHAGNQRIRDVEARDGRLFHQDDRADDERNQAADAQRAEGREERLGHHERDAEQDERQPGVVHRQEVQRVKREQQADRAHHPGQDEAGVHELEMSA